MESMDYRELPQRQQSPAEGGAPPPGAGACVRHPGQPASRVCVECGRPFCSECLFDWEGEAVCRACVSLYRAPEAFQAGEEPPGEEWGPRQIFTFRLFRSIVLSPARFFERMPRERGFGEPVFFAFGWGLFILVLSAPSQYLTLLLISSEAASLEMMAPKVVEIARATIEDGFWTFLAASPAYAIFMIASFLALASMQHFLLFLLGRRSRFELTLRVAFFSIAARSLAIVPVPGLSLLAAEVYTVAVQTVGFRKVYHLRTRTALFVSAVPMLIIQLIPVGVAGL